MAELNDGVVASFLARVIREPGIELRLEHRVTELITDDAGAVVGARAEGPGGVVDGRIDSTADGPGVSIVRFSGIIDTLLVTASTPIDEGQTETRFHFYVRSLGDDAINSSVGDAFASEVDKQFSEDMPIWEHKAHLARPAMADNDGPFMKFRKWYAQFYVDERPDDGRTVFPPPYWPDKMDETPAKATASAKHGDNG